MRRFALGTGWHNGFSAAVVPLVCIISVTPSGELKPASPPTGDGQRYAATWFGSPVMGSPEEQGGGATPTAYGDCGPGSNPTTGLQGQVPAADQASGRSKRGYSCNLRRVAANDIGRRGQNFQLAWYGDCAYVSTIGLREDTARLQEPDKLDGIAVVDVSDPRNPRVVNVLQSPKGKSSHEAMEVNEKRGLLVTTAGGLEAPYLETYDVKGDCRKPSFLGRYDAGVPMLHGLRVTEDGRTAYSSDVYDINGAGQVMHAVDISDPEHPKRLLTWAPEAETPADQHGIHDLDLSTDGNRLYAGTTPVQAALGVLLAGPPSVGPGTSLAILDTSEVQQREPQPDIKVVSHLSLPNIGHTVQRMRIDGKPYLLVSGEAPLGGPQNCPWAWGHIVDISDERNPRRVSDLKLEVNDLNSCADAAQDGAIYSIHYSGVDDEQNTKYVFYTYYTGGLRVFDVSDPTKPREVAYYQPPPTPGTKFPAAAPTTPDSGSSVFDYTTSVVRYRPETGEIWVVSVNAGFQVLRLTGAPAKQRATLRIVRRGARRAARRGFARVRLTCGQPCKAKVRLRVGSRRGRARAVELPRNGARTFRLRLGARGRAALLHSRRPRISARATIVDRLTGERQLTLRARPRVLRRYVSPEA
jgi:hypothetical protein